MSIISITSKRESLARVTRRHDAVVGIIASSCFSSEKINSAICAVNNYRRLLIILRHNAIWLRAAELRTGRGEGGKLESLREDV